MNEIQLASERIARLLDNGQFLKNIYENTQQRPAAGAVSFKDIEMEQRWSQTNSDIGRSHLVFLHTGHHFMEEEEEALESFSVLVRQDKDGSLDCCKLLILWEVCGG